MSDQSQLPIWLSIVLQVMTAIGGLIALGIAAWSHVSQNLRQRKELLRQKTEQLCELISALQALVEEMNRPGMSDDCSTLRANAPRFLDSLGKVLMLYARYFPNSPPQSVDARPILKAYETDIREILASFDPHSEHYGTPGQIYRRDHLMSLNQNILRSSNQIAEILSNIARLYGT